MISGKTDIDFRHIKNENELKIILNSLRDQGFGSFDDYKAHNYKIDRMINYANKFNIEQSKYRQYTENLYNLKDYTEIENKLQSIFSNYSEIDKIKEYLDIFYVSPTIKLKLPDVNTYQQEDNIIQWVKFKTKLNLKDINFIPGKTINFYDLDKKTIKIRYKENYEFQRLYELLFNKKCKDYKDDYGTWIDLDEIQIKLYQNGLAELSGNISQLKKYYYVELSKNTYYNYNIIIYNNKQIINNPTH